MYKEQLQKLATDQSPQQLINATIPLLDDLLGMWVVSKERKRLARALRDALTSARGLEIAGLIAPFFNPYGAEEGPEEA